MDKLLYFFFGIIVFVSYTIPLFHIVYSPIYRVLRNNKAYNQIFILTIILFAISVAIPNDSWSMAEKRNTIAPLAVFIFLILYYIFDKIIQLKYNRHFYFGSRIANYLNDKESLESTWLEGFLQVILGCIPLGFTALITGIIYK